MKLQSTDEKSTPNAVVKSSRIHGKGVFINKNLRKGEFILAIDDSEVVTDPRELTGHQRRFQCDYLENGKIVLMKRPERYINHSCTPNSFTRTVRGVRKEYAMRNIRKGEEITSDYSINGYGGRLECNCGSRACRKKVSGSFFDLPKTLQTKYYPYLDSWFKRQFKGRLKELQGKASVRRLLP